ncbi:expressed unknown protein [Seminavis robusta]|uniref:RanBP2-type domain-containing protein n=1 Tax=Seminavis robusta TaxID=568900 RepID=A0A9N8H8E9_9STRA|nr:expressed unknown protein [Seminavis robusta]|eukprot:Sro238_g095440.1 n/a (323) ;mRNA; f:13870-14838
MNKGPMMMITNQQAGSDLLLGGSREVCVEPQHSGHRRRKLSKSKSMDESTRRHWECRRRRRSSSRSIRKTCSAGSLILTTSTKVMDPMGISSSSNRRDAMATGSRRSNNTRDAMACSSNHENIPASSRISVSSSSSSSRQETMDTPQWSCGSCDHDNDDCHKFCVNCGTAKTWTCAGCNFDNNKCKFQFCGMCGSSKTSTEAQLPEEATEGAAVVVLADNQWQCRGCEQINTRPNIFCSMCGSSSSSAKQDKDDDASLSPGDDDDLPPKFVLVDETVMEDHDADIHYVSANSLLFDDSMEWFSDYDDDDDEESEYSESEAEI